MERRYSLSGLSLCPRLASPMADSTRIDASAMASAGPAPANGLALGLSPSRRPSLLNGSRTPDRSFDSNTVASISRQKLNLSQLDPKTFADVHSSGLASRIVAYHVANPEGRGGGLQRSMSAQNLCNPLSQPRRMAGAPLPYKAAVPMISMTRIAPPERSFYNGNTLPGLLRSNSLAGVVNKANEQQEQLSRENRPILHPPHPQFDSEPTRSVLDELKEISRKRINSGEPQMPPDYSKRSCQRAMDFVDHHSLHHPHNQHHNHQQQQQQQPQSFKRQRELTVAVPLRHHQTALGPTPMSLLHRHSNGPKSSPMKSPEQAAKRRNCSYSNDIASSLSSSSRHNHKRKLLDMRDSIRSRRNDSGVSGGSPDSSPGENVAKIQRKVDAGAIGKSQSMPVSVAQAVAPARTYSVPQAQSKAIQASEASPKATKPKLTLFNARQTDVGTTEPPVTKDLDSPDIDAGEYAGIQFVKPKKQNSALIRNTNVERTAKTKLAIMLSGLKGELYHEETDELDATVPAPAELPTPIKPTIAPAVTTTSTIANPAESKTTVAPSKPVILSDTLIKPADKPNITAASANSAGAAEAKQPEKSDKSAEAAKSETKFTLPISLPAPSATAAQPSMSAFGSPKSTEAAPKPALFSFGTPTATPTTSTTSNTATKSSPVFAFGQKPSVDNSTAQANFKLDTSINTTATTTNSAAPGATSFTLGSAAPQTALVKPVSSTTPSLSFAIPSSGISSTNTAPPASGSLSVAAPANNSSSMVPREAPKPFAFGQSNAPAAINSGDSATKPPAFSFGSTTPATAAVPPLTAALFGSQNKDTKKPFGGAFSTPAAPKSEPPKAEMFGGQNKSFASAFNPPAASTNTTEPAKAFQFNAGTPKDSGSAAPTNLFSFGGSTNPAKPTEAANASNPTTNPFDQGKSAATPFTFGAAASTGTSANNDSTPVFSFGGPAKAEADKPRQIFGFGAGDKTNAPATAPAAAAAVAPATPISSNNGFGFGSAQKTSTPMFGNGSAGSQGNTAAPEANKPFAFGGAQPAAASPAGGGFSFASIANKHAEPANKPSFVFGASSNNQGGAAAPAAGGFAFGSTGKKEEPTITNVFGSASAANTGIVKPTFNFGGSSSTAQTTPTFGGSSSTTAQPAPTFGGSSSTTAQPAPTFGGSSTAQTAPTFGGSSTAQTAPTFGGSLTALTAPTFGGSSSTPAKAASTFGGINSTPAKAAPTFGGSSTAQASPAFGGFGATASGASMAAPAANKPFAFGSNATGPAPGGNMFASAVSAAQNQPAKPASFSFGAVKSPTASTTPGNAPFAFGGAAAGGIASPPSNQGMNTAKPYTFGGASGNPAPTAFGSPAPSSVPQANSKPGAFAFGGATTAQQANATNLFAPTDNRPIRRATRRLQK
ncbi:hypothetical protein KR018_003211 [Drosophila ironensis]|nr:hypothetical protein KR018_003211 [Drosophila ironensis]